MENSFPAVAQAIGAIHFVTATGKLAKLAGPVGVFEHSTDPNDNVLSKLWEWSKLCIAPSYLVLRLLSRGTSRPVNP